MLIDYIEQFEQPIKIETEYNGKTLNIADFYLADKEQSTLSISNFDCNNGSMNAYLRENAIDDALSMRDEGCTTILIDDNSCIYAYYTILPSEIILSDDDICKCLHISRIATSKDIQRKGLGERLVRDIFNIAKRVGYRFISLDSLPNKVTWYEKIGFIPFEDINIQLSFEEINEPSICDLVYMYFDLQDTESLKEYLAG